MGGTRRSAAAARSARNAGRASAAALAFLILLAASPAAAAEPIPFPREEDFTYRIRFLFFERVAEARLHIRRVAGGRYRAELLAETKGLVGFLTAYRKNHYVAEMDYSPEKRRFITRRFTKLVTWGSEVVKSVGEMDYEKRENRWVATENGEVKDEGSERIPEGVIYEDMLSAFFNLRLGAFGPLTRGRRIAVTSLPYYGADERGRTDYEREPVRTFEIRIADALTERAYRRRFGRTNEKGLLVLVQVPRAFFGQKSGQVLVWFDANLIPIATRVEDVIFFGDVTGVLRRALVRGPTGAGGSSSKGVVEALPQG